MADSLEVSQKHYSRIETGNVDISVSKLLAICEVLDIKHQLLFGLDESKIFNSYTNNQQGGTFVAYNATEVEQIQKLYERMLEEKDKIINLLQSQNK
jgi:transcriptional regulator with XRE-family HTH domain